MNDVEYRDISWADGYRVGNDGTVWSRRALGPPGRLAANWRQLRLKAGGSNREYLMICLRPEPGGEMVHAYVHRVVLETFVGPCPEGMGARHLDGNPHNNRLDNLCWSTQKENLADKRRHGTQTYGERHPVAKLTDDSIRLIRQLRAEGMLQKEIGAIIGVTQSHVSAILLRKRWRDI